MVFINEMSKLDPLQFDRRLIWVHYENVQVDVVNWQILGFEVRKRSSNTWSQGKIQ